MLSPLEDFIHRQTTSGILLMLCAVVAIYIANSQWSEVYHHLLAIPFTIGIPGFQLSKSLYHWINDGLMIVVGELASEYGHPVRQAKLAHWMSFFYIFLYS